MGISRRSFLKVFGATVVLVSTPIQAVNFLSQPPKNVELFGGYDKPMDRFWIRVSAESKGRTIHDLILINAESLERISFESISDNINNTLRYNNVHAGITGNQIQELFHGRS